MLLSDIHHEASDMEARALRQSSWAKPYESRHSITPGRSPRQVVGRALMSLGRIIAAEPAPHTAQISANR